MSKAYLGALMELTSIYKTRRIYSDDKVMVKGLRPTFVILDEILEEDAMGWGEPHTSGAGSTGDIEAAHNALDQLGIESGTLAVRALAAAEIISGLRQELLNGKYSSGSTSRSVSDPCFWNR